MSEKVTITWRGHSCFKLEDSGYTILTDPYADNNVPGMAPLRDQANLVLASHGHGDHGAVDLIECVETDQPNPFTITSVTCPHDDADGAKRGMVTIRVFDNGTLRIAHFGDIGCPLSKEQRAQIGQLDVAMVPVGGFYTMEPDGIQELMTQLNPRIVIPMHYRSETFGYPVIGTIDAFLQYRDDVVVYDTNVLEVTKETPSQTAVLKYLG